MAARDNSTVICSVAFVDIVDYAKMSVETQLHSRARCNETLTQALGELPAAARIVLDTVEGVAIAFVGGAHACLGFASRLRDAIGSDTDGAVSVRAGINHGPVRLIKDPSGQPNLIGDGIEVGQRIVRFAAPSQILVSRPYHEALIALDRQYGRCFDFLGARTDQQVRSHDVYALNAAPMPKIAMRAPATGAAATKASGSMPASMRASILGRPPLATGLAVGAILLLSVLMRQWTHRVELRTERDTLADTPLATPQSGREPKLPEPPAPAAVPQPAPPPARIAAPAPAPAVSAPATAFPKPREAAALNGTVRITVVPWGEVLVDGEKVGVAPPLRDIPLKAGRHRVEIRNPGFASHLQSLDVRAGEEIRIRHRFE